MAASEESGGESSTISSVSSVARRHAQLLAADSGGGGGGGGGGGDGGSEGSEGWSRVDLEELAGAGALSDVDPDPIPRCPRGPQRRVRQGGSAAARGSRGRNFTARTVLTMLRIVLRLYSGAKWSRSVCVLFLLVA